jgi:hypothetical protein
MPGPVRGMSGVGAILCAAGAAAGQVLHSNGPMLTSLNVCTAAPTGSTSQLQLSNSTFGFGTQPGIAGRVADDWTVPPGAGWTVTGFVFFGYQTFGTSTSATISSVTIRIWNGCPGTGGASVIWGDTTTNRLVDAQFAGVFRVAQAGSDCSLDRPVYGLTCVIPPQVLASGTYWVDWQAAGNGQLPSGPWAVPVTITGQAAAAGANALGTNSTISGWVPLTDLASQAVQDLAFQVSGTPVQSCYANCDGSTSVPFLNISDFACFLNLFSSGASYANCDGSTQVPVLNVFDFACFLNLFTAGCSAP